MSNLPGNPHAEAWKDESDGAWGMTQATLSLAYEQRTANLIAVATAVGGDGIYQLDPVLIGAAQEEIAKRLGMEAGE